MKLLAIDPGSTESAFVVFDGDTERKFLEFAKIPNEALVSRIRQWKDSGNGPDTCAVEQIRGYGMTAGNELFDTCMWSGRFCEAFGADNVHWLPRKTVITQICGSPKANDSDLRAALIDRFGPPTFPSGMKKPKTLPGPTNGFARDTWAALAVAACFWDQRVYQLLKQEVTMR